MIFQAPTSKDVQPSKRSILERLKFKLWMRPMGSSLDDPIDIYIFFCQMNDTFDSKIVDQMKGFSQV